MFKKKRYVLVGLLGIIILIGGFLMIKGEGSMSILSPLKSFGVYSTNLIELTTNPSIFYFDKDNEGTNITYYIKDGTDKIIIPYTDYLNETDKFGFTFNETEIQKELELTSYDFNNRIYYEINSLEDYERYSDFILQRNLYDEVAVYNQTCIEYSKDLNEFGEYDCLEIDGGFLYYSYPAKKETIVNEIGQIETKQLKRFIDFSEIFTKDVNLYKYVTTEELVCVECNGTDIDYECLKTELRNITTRQKRVFDYSFTKDKGKWIIEFINLFDLDPIFRDDTDSNWDLGTFINMKTEGTGSGANLTSNRTTGGYLSRILDSESTITEWGNITYGLEYPYGEELPALMQDLPEMNMTGNVLYLRMNNDSSVGENETYIYDWSGNGNYGLFSNNDSRGDGVDGVSGVNKSGKFGGGFALDGDSDDIRNITHDDTGVYPLTVSIWTYAENVTMGSYNGVNYSFLINKRDNVVDRHWQMSYADSVMRVNVFNGSADGGGNVVSTEPSNLNVWEHHVFTTTGVEGGNLSLYKNGVVINSSTLTENRKTGSREIVIGRNSWIFPATFQYKGRVDEVAIWNRSLSAEEISNLYNRGAVKFNISVRSCDDSLCSGETWNITTNNASFGRIEDLTSQDNRYFQYQINYTNSSDATVRVNNVSIEYSDYVPHINFTVPTPANASSQSNTDIYVNYSVTDSDAYSFINFDRSLVGWWRMDNDSSKGENDTSVYDWSGNLNNGTTVSMGHPIWNSSGKFGGGFTFNGSGDYIDVGDIAEVDNSNTQITIASWVKFNSIPENGADSSTRQEILSKYDSVNNQREFMLYLSSAFGGLILNNSALMFNVQENADSYNANSLLSSATVFQIDTWYNVVATFNSSTFMRIYVNGVLDSELTSGVPTDFTDTAEPLIIGANQDGSSLYINGSIDEVLIFNRSLSAEEIQALYNATKTYHNFTSQAVGNHTFTANVVDSAGNWNVTKTRLVEINTEGGSPTDPCACSGVGVNKEYDLADNCQVNKTCDMTGGNITFTGTGSWWCNSTITCNKFSVLDVAGAFYHRNSTCQILMGN